ncbi:YoaK family protein [Novosphingobium sp.]|uniref:YoaK family protein n=1 Tax=Novosphingobium sp. TaxID=1874826 RepID=UPI0038B904A6
MITHDRARRRFAIALAALAGFVDAVGFLSAGGYFVSFMSGNTTRLAVLLATDPLRAVTPLLLIAGFVAGVILGSLVAHHADRWRKPALLGVVAGLLLAAAIARTIGLPVAMLAAMVLAMGAINAMFQRDGEVSIGLTYMTGALVKLGQGLAARLLGQPRKGWPAWGLLWTGLLGGAVLGALMQDRAPLACLWLATGWALALLPIAVRLPADND